MVVVVVVAAAISHQVKIHLRWQPGSKPKVSERKGVTTMTLLTKCMQKTHTEAAVIVNLLDMKAARKYTSTNL